MAMQEITDLSLVSDDLERLNHDVNNIFACNILEHTYYQLAKMGPWKVDELDLDLMFKMDALQSAIVIAYGRIFAGGVRTVSRSKVPPDLRQTHDDIISLRNKRYAHHDSHPTINIATTVHDAGDRFMISQEMKFLLCIGAPQDWKPLFEWLRGHLHDRLHKQIARLEEKTGRKWSFPTGDPPYWLSIDGS